MEEIKSKKQKIIKKKQLIIEEDNEITNKVLDINSINTFINKIINDDAEKALKNLPPNSVDVTVTSPPYDDIRDYMLWSHYGHIMVTETYYGHRDIYTISYQSFPLALK